MSKEKEETVNMVIGMRKRLKALTAEKRQEMNISDSDTKATDLFELLIQANDSCDFQRDLLDDYVVDDILTIYLVMDNMVRQLTSVEVLE